MNDKGDQEAAIRDYAKTIERLLKGIA
jgi:hypothetical protein